uniref:Uncharacterized protein n=1 Tax=Timema cristinae TaxID=61476 RepID=A0A7R9GZL0_TIMCR|nr:unnamed protein product [Timema cristinae]
MFLLLRNLRVLPQTLVVEDLAEEALAAAMTVAVKCSTLIPKSEEWGSSNTLLFWHSLAGPSSYQRYSPRWSHLFSHLSQPPEARLNVSAMAALQCRDYPKPLRDIQISRALSRDDYDPPKEVEDIPLTTQYHPGLQRINTILKSGYKFLASFNQTQNFLSSPPRVTLKWPPKLPDPKRIREEKPTTKGSYPCSSTRCSTCGIDLPTTPFNSKMIVLELNKDKSGSESDSSDHNDIDIECNNDNEDPDLFDVPNENVGNTGPLHDFTVGSNELYSTSVRKEEAGSQATRRSLGRDTSPTFKVRVRHTSLSTSPTFKVRVRHTSLSTSPTFKVRVRHTSLSTSPTFKVRVRHTILSTSPTFKVRVRHTSLSTSPTFKVRVRHTILSTSPTFKVRVRHTSLSTSPTFKVRVRHTILSTSPTFKVRVRHTSLSTSPTFKVRVRHTILSTSPTFKVRVRHTSLSTSPTFKVRVRHTILSTSPTFKVRVRHTSLSTSPTFKVRVRHTILSTSPTFKVRVRHTSLSTSPTFKVRVRHTILSTSPTFKVRVRHTSLSTSPTFKVRVRHTILSTSPTFKVRVRHTSLSTSPTFKVRVRHTILSTSPTFKVRVRHTSLSTSPTFKVRVRHTILSTSPTFKVRVRHTSLSTSPTFKVRVRHTSLSTSPTFKVRVRHTILSTSPTFKVRVRHTSLSTSPTFKYHQVHLTEIRTSIFLSSAVELNTTSALANYATEAGSVLKEHEKKLDGFEKTTTLFGHLALHHPIGKFESLHVNGLGQVERRQLLTENLGLRRRLLVAWINPEQFLQTLGCYGRFPTAKMEVSCLTPHGIRRLYLEKVELDLCGGRVENHYGKSTLSTPNQDLNLDLPFIRSLVYYERRALNHVAPKRVYSIRVANPQTNLVLAIPIHGIFQHLGGSIKVTICQVQCDQSADNTRLEGGLTKVLKNATRLFPVPLLYG